MSAPGSDPRSAPDLDARQTRRYSPLVGRIGGKGAEAWAVHAAAVARAAAGEDVITLSVGDPDFDTPRPIVEAAVAELRAGNTHYTAFAGTAALREAIARYQTGLRVRDIGPD